MLPASMSLGAYIQYDLANEKTRENPNYYTCSITIQNQLLLSACDRRKLFSMLAFLPDFDQINKTPRSDHLGSVVKWNLYSILYSILLLSSFRLALITSLITIQIN